MFKFAFAVGSHRGDKGQQCLPVHDAKELYFAVAALSVENLDARFSGCGFQRLCKTVYGIKLLKHCHAPRQ